MSFAPTQPSTTGQRHHHHHHHSQHQMTPVQARPAPYASVAAPSGSLQPVAAPSGSSQPVAAPSGSPQPVVAPSAIPRLAPKPARKNSSLSIQPARHSEAPRSKPAAEFITYHAPVPLDLGPAPSQPITGGAGASRDPRLRLANKLTATPPISASPTPPRPSQVLETTAGSQRKKRSSNEATGEAKRYCHSGSPLLNNLDGMMSTNIRPAMTGPAPNESRTKESKEGKYVGSSKTPAKSSKLRAPTSSAQPPTTGQPHLQHKMTPTQTRPASYSGVAAPSGSPQPVLPLWLAEYLAVPPARKNSDPCMQPASRSESLRSKLVAASARYRRKVDSAPHQPMTGHSANAQTTTPPRDVRVNTVTDTQMFPTPSLEDIKTMARSQQRERSSHEASGEAKRYCGSRSAPLDNPNTMKSSNIRAATTGPAPNESTTKKSMEGKYVGSSKTPAKSSIPRMPTSSTQPPTTGQPHPQHQMTSAQARPASHACIAFPSGSQQSVVPSSAAAHLAKHSNSSVRPARSSEAPHSVPVAAFATYCTYEVPAPCQPMTGRVGASCDPRLRSANAQTMTPPVPASPAPPRAAVYDSSAPLDTPMLPTPSLENVETMARPQLRKWSYDDTTRGGKWYCGSRSPLLNNLNRSMSLLNIRAAMTDPAPNESRTKEPKEGQCVGSSKTLAELSKPQAPTSSAQPPTTGQSQQHQMTPAQGQPASSASVVAPSNLRTPPLENLNTMDNAGASCVAPGPQDSELLNHLLDLCSALAVAIRSMAVADASPQDSELSSRKNEDLVSVLAEAFRCMAVADASRAASGPQNSELSSRKILDLVSVLAEAFRSMAVADASRAASGPQDSELSSRKNEDLVSVLAEVFRSMVVAYARHAASGPQDPELSRKILDLFSVLAEAFRSIAVANASRTSSDINQVKQLSPYSESNRSEPKKDEKKSLKTKKTREAYKKIIAKNTAVIKECKEKNKKIKMSTMKEKAKKRLERRKSLMERDLEIIRRVDEDLKQTDQ